MKMRFTIAVIILGLTLGGASASLACDHTCPTGYTWVSKNGNNGDDGSCVANPVTDPSTNSTNNNSNSNSNSNQNSNTATGGSSKSTSTATGGNANATGGKSTSNSSTGPINVKTGGATTSTGPVSASGGAASVTNSGNSSATGGAGGQGGAGGSVEHSGNSNNQNVNNVTDSSQSVSGSSSSGSGNSTTVQTNIPRQTASALAPEVFPSASCFKGFSGAGQGPAFGFSFGGGKIDQDCSAREDARIFAAIGSRLAACKVLVSTKQAKAANISLSDCMAQEEPRPVPVSLTPVHIAEVVPPDALPGAGR